MEMIDEKITFEQMKEIDKSLKEAENDDTPFLVVGDDEIAVAGDANKTERKSKTYTLNCRFPVALRDTIKEDIKITKEVGNFVFGEYTVNDVYLSPREDFRVISAISKIYPYFKKLKEDGGVEDLSEKEILELAINMEKEVRDAMYEVVGAFLQLTDEFLSCILTSSIFETLLQLIYDFPEAFNEADVFFG